MGKKTDKYLGDMQAIAGDCANMLTNLIAETKTMAKLISDMHSVAWGSPQEAQMQTLREACWDRGVDLLNRLKTRLKDFDLTLSPFRTYITKKEKSKNPFKSKKSIPAAKAAIQAYDRFRQDCLTAQTAGGRVFH